MSLCDIVFSCTIALRKAFCVSAGVYPNSCTATTHALIWWLCGKELTLSDIGQEDRQAPDTVMWQSPALAIFHTPHHKFGFLCIDNQACLLHSNQDVFHEGGKAFTFQKYLEESQFYILSEQEFCQFCQDLKTASTDFDKCRRFFEHHFGIGFARGQASNYWVTQMPVLFVPAPV
jgi:hypothetical protein